MEREKEKRLRDLLIKATTDMEFRERFLKDPVAVGKENGVSFNKEQLEKIKSTANFIASLSDIRVPIGPIIYPIDPILQRWRVREIIRVLRYFIFYPGPIEEPWILRRGARLEKHY